MVDHFSQTCSSNIASESFQFASWTMNHFEDVCTINKRSPRIANIAENQTQFRKVVTIVWHLHQSHSHLTT